MGLLLFALILLRLFSTGNLVYCEKRFEPITEDIAFRVSYEIQASIDGEASLFTEIQEQYQHNLASANIEQINYDSRTREVSRRFIFNAESRRIIEIANNSRYSYDGSSLRKPNLISEARQTFESELLKFQSSDLMTQLDFDSFLTDDCYEKISKKLFYIKGITKLLHLIECRREEIIALDYGSQASELDKIAYTRNQKSSVYTSDKLLSLRGRVDDYSINSLSKGIMKSMRITVYMPYEKVSLKQKGGENRLPSRIIPLCISLQFEQGLLVIINVFQFDVMDLMEHISETTSGVVSDFLVPVASGLSDVLFYSSSSFNDNQTGSSSKRRRNALRKDQFSFRALLTGSNLPLEDPVELLVAYDRENRMLVREIILTDRSVSLGDRWKTHKSRLVYDGESFTKFHIKNSNEDYTESNSRETSSNWRSCVKNTLSGTEIYTLDGSSASSELFDLESSTYMGMAEIRGIACYVYEKRVFRFPLWLGLGETEISYLSEATTIAEDSEIYLTFYESISDYVGESYENEKIERYRDSSTQNIHSTSHSKLVRLEINVVRNEVNKDNASGRIQLLNYVLEVHSFDWSISLVHDELELFDVSQECLLSDVNSKYLRLDLSMEFALDEENSKSFISLKGDSNLCKDTVSKTLSKYLPITKTEQVDLETDISSNNLHASLYVYEISRQGSMSKFMGYAQDLSLGSAATNSWEFGATSLSLDECDWRAAHTLRPMKLTDLANKGGSDDETNSKLFMYCPKTLHCILGDSSWNPIYQRKAFSNRQIKYPADETGISNKCIVMAISVVGQSVIRNKDLRGKSLVEWLASKSEESMMQLPLDVKVDELSIPAKITRFKASQIVDKSLEPITGLGYEKTSEVGPMIVSNMARCSHTCLVLHNCASYSVCHHQEAHLECIFTTIDWTGQAEKLNELKKQSTSGLPLSIGVQLADNNSVHQVKLKRSSLCTIYSQEHLDVFRFKESLLVHITPEYLLNVKSIKECAKFCLERGDFFSRMKPLLSENKRSVLKGSQRQFTCTSFMFDIHLKTCELKPDFEFRTLKTSEYIESQVKQGQSSASRWQESLYTMRERIYSLPASSEVEIYELNFAQLFEVSSDKRLISSNVNDLPSSSSSLYAELQLAIQDTGVEKCAKLCLPREGCRSFDIYTQAGSGQVSMIKKSTCVLNAYSLNDISNLISQNGKHSELPLKLQLNRGSTGEASDDSGESVDDLSQWFHYEPSELALYLIGDSPRLSSSSETMPTTTTTTTSNDQQQQSRILINISQATIYILPLVATTDSSFHGSKQISLYDNGEINNSNSSDSSSWNIAMVVLFYAALIIAIILIVSINLYLFLSDRGSTGWKKVFSCHYCRNYFAIRSTSLFCSNRC